MQLFFTYQKLAHFQQVVSDALKYVRWINYHVDLLWGLTWVFETRLKLVHVPVDTLRENSLIVHLFFYYITNHS